jgi:hypothetical protein
MNMGNLYPTAAMVLLAAGVMSLLISLLHKLQRVKQGGWWGYGWKGSFLLGLANLSMAARFLIPPRDSTSDTLSMVASVGAAAFLVAAIVIMGRDKKQFKANSEGR